MAKTTKTYLSGCTWCNATGFIKHPSAGFMASPLTDICPVCNGAKTITVTETVEDFISTHDLTEIDNVEKERK